MVQPLDKLVTIGPFFSGDTGPDIEFLCSWDSGGYVPLTGADINGVVRRWDPRRKVPLGSEITSGSLTIINAISGDTSFDWTLANPISTVPVDPGWYMIQITITFPSGKSQLSQRVVFEVLSS
jgi:uncharacterized protein YciI